MNEVKVLPLVALPFKREGFPPRTKVGRVAPFVGMVVAYAWAYHQYMHR